MGQPEQPAGECWFSAVIDLMKGTFFNPDNAPAKGGVKDV